MRFIQHPRKGALGERARVVFHLLQALEPEVADAVEIVVLEIRRRHDLVNQLQSRLEESIERCQSDDDRVHAGLEIEVAADPRDAIGNLEGRLAAAAFVEQSRGDRDKAMRVGRVNGRAAGHDQHDRHDRHRAMAHGAQLESVGERAPDNPREMKGTIGSRKGQPAAVDGHETCTSSAPGSARSRRPFGTTLKETDGACTSHLLTAAAAALLVTSK